MWKRKPYVDDRTDSRPAVHDPRASAPGLGVGVQVWVREQSPATGDDWVGEPTGVIVSVGDHNVRNVTLPVDGLTTWLVAFSEPQRRRDGRGPFATAVISAGLLVPAEPEEG